MRFSLIVGLLIVSSCLHEPDETGSNSDYKLNSNVSDTTIALTDTLYVSVGPESDRNITEYTWVVNGIKEISESGKDTITFLDSGSYTIEVTATDDKNNNSETLVFNIQVTLTTGIPVNNWQTIVSTSPTAWDLNKIFYFPPAHLWAVGNYGTIAYSPSGGNEWTLQTAPEIDDLWDVFFIDESNGWSAGNSENIYRTTNGGETWTASALSDSLTNIEIVSLFFLDNHTGWAVGFVGFQTLPDGIIFKTTDGGLTWAPQEFPIDNLHSSVFFIDENTGWVGGGNPFSSIPKGHILHTSDGGLTWAEQDVPVGEVWRQITFTDPNMGTAIGLSGSILTTSDGGATWESVRVRSIYDDDPVGDALRYFYGVHFPDPSHGWGFKSIDETLIHTSDAGATWVEQDIGTGNFINDLFFSNNSNGWAVGRKGTILTTTNGGADWTQLSSENFDYTSVYFADLNNGWAVGDLGVIRKSSDGGLSWSNQDSGIRDALRSVFFVDENTGWAVGDNGNIQKTEDGGQNWKSQKSFSHPFTDVHFTNNETGYVVGHRGAIYKTTSGGDSWDGLTTGTETHFFSVYFADALNGWVAGYDGVIFNTVDGGSTWTPQTSGVTSHINDIYFINDMQGWAAGLSAVLLSTTDGGATWTSQNSGISEHLHLYQVRFPEESLGWAIGSSSRLFSTTNGGSSWTEVNHGRDETFTGLHFLSGSAGWVVGSGGLILKGVP